MFETALLPREHILSWVEKIEYKDGKDDHTVVHYFPLVFSHSFAPFRP